MWRRNETGGWQDNLKGTAMTLFASFAVFRNRAFTLLWAAQLISTMGSALTRLAAALVVYRLTGSALSVGLMMLAPTLPSLFVGLLAGVVVDRFDRKQLMIAANLGCAGLVALIPLLLPLHIAWLYVLVILSGAVGQFYNPAHEGLLPEVASDEELAAANALMAISTYGSQAVGFAASGLLAASVSIAWAFYLDALSFVLAAGCIVGVRVARFPVEGHTTLPTVVHDLRVGVRFLGSKPILRSLFLIYMPVFVCFGLGTALLLPLSQRALHATEFEYGLIAALEAAGFILGSLLIARLAGRQPAGRWIALSFLGMGVFGIALSQLPTVPLVALVILIVGINNAPSIVGRQLVIQRNTPRELRGRVNSAFFVTRDVMYMIGMALAGLADFVDVRTLYLGGEVVVLAAGALVLILPGLGRPVADWRRALGHWWAPRPVAAPESVPASYRPVD